jgi:hypothetical protein
MVDLGRSLQSGSGRADLATHVSTPREPWPPLCTVIKETERTCFTHAWDVRSNVVISRDVRPLGPLRI